MLASALLLGVAAHAQDAGGESAVPDLGALGQRITALALEGAQANTTPQMRVVVEVGSLDPRLKLAPCARIEPYLPAGLPAWGRTRIGLRCTEGPKAWNVSLPVTVHVWARSLVLTSHLPQGTVLEAQHLAETEVDLAAAPGAAVSQLTQALGRSLARTLTAGAALRVPDLKARQWFAAGDTVKVVAAGKGWRIATEGQAVTPGLEGQLARVRTDNGRILQGRPVAEREVEVAL
jgi:flagella basal body P-ring formation protein FlgA